MPTQPAPKHNHCLLTQAPLTPETGLRLVKSPEGHIVLDRGNTPLPGQFAWVTCSEKILQQAITEGHLSRHFGEDSVIPPQFPEKVRMQLTQAFLQQLGMAQKAGALALGTPQILQAIKAHKVYLLVAAEDASPATLNKIQLKAGKIRWFSLCNKQQIGKALGKADIACVAITDTRWSIPVQRAIETLHRYCKEK